jgi:hypothetical protein
MTAPQTKNGKNSRPSTNNYMKYSSLAFQMLGTIVVFTYGGYKLDEWQHNIIPVWTLVLSLVSIAGSLYRFIRAVTKE